MTPAFSSFASNKIEEKKKKSDFVTICFMFFSVRQSWYVKKHVSHIKDKQYEKRVDNVLIELVGTHIQNMK